MREHHLCTIFKLYINLFCLQRIGLEVLIKMTSEAGIVSWGKKNQGGSWVKKAPHAPDHNYE